VQERAKYHNRVASDTDKAKAPTDGDAFEQILGTAHVPPSANDFGSPLDRWFARVTATERGQRIYHLGVPIVVFLIAALARLWNLGHPAQLVFDETFYVKDGWSLVNLGYSSTWPDNANDGFATGNVNTFTTTGSYVVHPPLGKWIIGAGMAAFGPENPVSWRIMTALVGILAVVVLFFIARSLFHSTLLAGLAAGLFAIDGNAIVMSRVALLDNFVMFFALLGFGAMLLDRRWSARRLDDWVARQRANGGQLRFGPTMLYRPWLVAAAVAFGLTSAVKWSGLYFLAAFAVYSVVVDALARRRRGIPLWFTDTLVRQAPASFVLTVPIALAVHMSTWISWFTTSGGYGRTWADSDGNAWTGIFSWVPHSIQSWLHYQEMVYTFHVNESQPHPYAANPLGWLLMIRPTSMYYQGATNGQLGCTFDSCGSSIAGIANPLIWWAGSAALVYLVFRLLQHRDWKAGFILMGIVGGYLPWMLYLNRTVFQFYTIAFEPYMMLALAMAIGAILGNRRDSSWQRQRALRFVGLYLALVVAVSIFFWPLWSATQIDFTLMRAHWWLPLWK
jgi:dolichyl-phosphate-mannose-protein mannosyltransferase